MSDRPSWLVGVDESEPVRHVAAREMWRLAVEEASRKGTRPEVEVGTVAKLRDDLYQASRLPGEITVGDFVAEYRMAKSVRGSRNWSEVIADFALERSRLTGETFEQALDWVRKSAPNVWREYEEQRSFLT